MLLLQVVWLLRVLWYLLGLLRWWRAGLPRLLRGLSLAYVVYRWYATWLLLLLHSRGLLLLLRLVHVMRCVVTQ